MLQCLPLFKYLLEHQNTKRLEGSKNNCVQLQSGQISDKRYKKTKKSQLSFLKSQEQKQGFESKNSVHASCTQDPKGVDKTPKPPLRANPWTNPCFYPHRRNKLTHPSGLSQQGNLWFPHSPDALGSPINPWLNFLSSGGSVSLDWGGQEAQSVTKSFNVFRSLFMS